MKEGNAGREGSSIPGGRSSYLKSINIFLKKKTKRRMIDHQETIPKLKKSKEDIPANQQSASPRPTPNAPSTPTLLPLHQLRPRRTPAWQLLHLQLHRLKPRVVPLLEAGPYFLWRGEMRRAKGVVGRMFRNRRTIQLKRKKKMSSAALLRISEGEGFDMPRSK